jgi:hypothetical protein
VRAEPAICDAFVVEERAVFWDTAPPQRVNASSSSPSDTSTTVREYAHAGTSGGERGEAQPPGNAAR